MENGTTMMRLAIETGLRAALFPDPFRLLASTIAAKIVGGLQPRVSSHEISRWEDDGGTRLAS
jgi:hypothetical protein